jgi:DNA invertase Pin-like site-specific DNA recombinase
MERNNRAIIWCAVSSRQQAHEDKDSLAFQERELIALAESHGRVVADILRVPGHSRRYTDIHALAASARAQGIDAFDKFLQHIKNKDFGWLYVWDGDRLARTQALHAYIVEETIGIGASIFSKLDGEINGFNFRMWIAMAGHRAAGEVDKIIARQKFGKDKLFERGLPTEGRVPFSHVPVRDQTSGRIVRIVVDESRRHFWDCVFHAIVEKRVPWSKLGPTLAEAYGIRNDKGEAWNSYTIYRAMLTPIFWGHVSRFHSDKHLPGGERRGEWVYDSSVAPPASVEIHYHAHPPVFTGVQAERLKAELRRRSRDNMRGSRHPMFSHRLSGLLVCDECGRVLNTFVINKPGKPQYRGLFCPHAKDRQCSQRGVKSEAAYIDQIHPILQRMIDLSTTDINPYSIPEEPSQVTHYTTEIKRLQDAIAVLIREQSSAPDAAQTLYRQQISALSDELSHARRFIETERQKVEQRRVRSQNAALTLQRLRDVSLDAFWDWPSGKINQTLHELFNGRKLIVRDKRIIGIREMHKRVPRRD